MKLSKALLIVGFGAVAGLTYAACKKSGKRIEVRLVPNEHFKENLMVRDCGCKKESSDTSYKKAELDTDFSFEDTNSYDIDEENNTDDFSACKASEAFATTEGEAQI